MPTMHFSIQRLFDEQCADDCRTRTDGACSKGRKCIGKVLKELDSPKDRRVLFSRLRQPTTNERSDEDAQITGKGEETKSPCLSPRRTVLRNHASHSDNCAREDSCETPEKDHLPDRFA